MGLENTVAGEWPQNQKVLSDIHIRRRKIELAVTFFGLRPFFFFFFLAVEIKTNFDLFYSEPDKDIKARILPLILFAVSTGFSASWGWGQKYLWIDIFFKFIYF